MNLFCLFTDNIIVEQTSLCLVLKLAKTSDGLSLMGRFNRAI